MKIIFYLPVNTDKPKFIALLVFDDTTASFIAQISSSENFRAILAQATQQWIAKEGYSELWEPIKMRKNCYSLIC